MTTAASEDAPTPGADPEAPYGRKLDGTPKKTPGGRPPGTGSKPQTKTQKTTGFRVPSPSRHTKPNTPRPKGTDYRPGLSALLGIALIPLGFAAPLDAAAFALSSDEIVDAFNTTAQERPEIAALCERLNKVGPYGLIFTALAKPLAQVAVNHKVIPLAMGEKFGAVHPDVLGQQLGIMVQAREEAAQAESLVDEEALRAEVERQAAARQAAGDPPMDPASMPFAVVR